MGLTPPGMVGLTGSPVGAAIFIVNPMTARKASNEPRRPDLARVADVVGAARHPGTATAGNHGVGETAKTPWRSSWRAGWAHLLFLVLDLPVAVAAIVVVSFVVTGLAALPGLGFGLVFLIPALVAARALGALERLRIEGFTGVIIPPPRQDPSLPTWRRLTLEPTRWRAVAYCALQMLWGLLIGSTILMAIAVCLATAAMPLFASVVRETGWTVLDLFTVTSPPLLVLVWMAGCAGLVVLPLIAPALSAVDVNLARWLIGQDQRRQIEHLNSRVDTLTATRTAAVDSAEAERRRIERDLHDGPQQRLVSIAMDLGMAKNALQRNPETAQSLLDQAHASSKEAIVEMRQVTRGIAPPVLTDRGLDAALSALAARTAVPVRVDVPDIGRLNPTLEAIAYFCVSEALTNVTKHAKATSAQVSVERVKAPGSPGAPPRSQVVLTVSDDGVGGADPLTGTGLTGLRQRLSAVDGTLTVFSPPGGPTVLTAVLPEQSTPRHPVDAV